MNLTTLLPTAALLLVASALPIGRTFAERLVDESARDTLQENRPVFQTISTKDDYKKLIVGSWKSKDDESVERFAADGTYTSSLVLRETFPMELIDDIEGVATFDYTAEVRGTWSIAGNKLKLLIKKVEKFAQNKPFQLTSAAFKEKYGAKMLEEVRGSVEKELLETMPKELEETYAKGLEVEIVELTRKVLKVKSEVDGEVTVETNFRVE